MCRFFNRPFSNGLDIQDGMHAEQLFYNGMGHLQEETETVFESADGTPTSVLREDGRKIREFYLGQGSYSKVQWPSMLSNFDPSTCEANAAYCVWPRDRQANDGNGNCAKPYDENCVDKDVADNTNLCFADLDDGNRSSGFDSKLGFMSFPEDNNAGEGAIHCHGFAWADDEYHHTARYKANNLFYVSAYDHLHQRGYSEEIPGMPMCGCVDQMPMTTRCDCTQVDPVEDWIMEFDGSSFKGTILKVDIDFNACHGRGGRRNDLWTYVARLYDEGKQDRKHFGATGRKITNDSTCYWQTEHQKALKGVSPKYIHEEDKWTQVAGRDENWSAPYSEISLAVAAEHSFTGQDSFILMRTCPHCIEAHRKIFYKRKTPVPENFNLVHSLTFYRDGNVPAGNAWKTDFDLYSTYEEAVAGDESVAWKCPDRNGNGQADAPDFNYWATGHGECSPGGNRVPEQYSVYSWHPGPKPNVGWYLNAPEASGLAEYDVKQDRSADATAVDIGYPGVPGFVMQSEDGIHIGGSGDNIGGSYDMFHFMNEPMSGDVDVKVRVTDIANPGGTRDAKVGVMIRSDLTPRSAYAYSLLTANDGIKSQFRRSEGKGAENAVDVCCHCSTKRNCVMKDAAWLRIVKKMEKFEFYYGDDGIDWTPFGTVTLFLPEDEFYVGLAVTSKNNGHLTEATFTDYSPETYVFPTSAPSISLAPTPWNPSVDIGDPAGKGSFWVSNGIDYMNGGGTQLYGTHDEFFFYNQQMSLSDVGAVEVFINRFDNWSQKSRGGIMIRQDNEADSAHVFLGAAGADLGVELQTRSAAGERAVIHAFKYVNNINQFWVRLERSGDEYKALYKTADATEWTELGTASVSFSDTVQVGRAVSAGRTDQYHYRLETKFYSVEP